MLLVSVDQEQLHCFKINYLQNSKILLYLPLKKNPALIISCELMK